MENKHNEKEILEALRKSRGGEILAKINTGLDSHLYRMFQDDMIELPGGEMQKVALARTFFRNCSVLVLDEPSSALDPVTENQIYESIIEQVSNRITILISHRLSCALKADKIIVMKQGEIIEQGSHGELLSLAQEYARMYHYQADRYK